MKTANSTATLRTVGFKFECANCGCRFTIDAYPTPMPYTGSRDWYCPTCGNDADKPERK